MEANSQHEFHPDAESLNAFAEHALEEQERGEVLKHLAVCGRCRQVVALAWDAAGVEAAVRVASPAARPAIVQPNTWWRRWRLVWVPTAVVAAFAVASISVYIRQTGQHDANIKIAEQTPTQGKGPASVPPQPIESEAAPPPTAPAPAAPVPRAANALKAERSGAETRRQRQEAAAPSAMSRELEVTGRAEPAPLPAAAASSAEAPGLVGEGLLAGGKPTLYKTPAAAAWQEAQKQQEQKKLQAGPLAVHGQMFGAEAAAPANDHGANKGALPSSAQVVVLNSEAEMQAAPVTSFGGFERSRPATIIAGAEKSIHLPSSLPSVSIASADHRMLAIDEAGALFVSEDSGRTWVRVPPQWSGLAKVVRKQTAGQGSAEEAPATERPEKPSADTGGAPSPAAVFELLNDKGQTWMSTDGMTWTAK